LEDPLPGGIVVYWLSFPEIAIDKPGEYRFRIGGLPRGDYRFGLALPAGGCEERRVEIARRGAQCHVEITTNSGGEDVHLGGLLENDKSGDRGAFDAESGHVIRGARRCIYMAREVELFDIENKGQESSYVIRINVLVDNLFQREGAEKMPRLTPMLWCPAIHG
jgi:hypothetical protein